MAPDKSNTVDPKPVTLGRISGLYGVRGWIRVFSYTEPRDALLNYKKWLVDLRGKWRPVGLAEGRQQGKSVVARLDGVDDRDAAAGYVGADIAVDRECLPQAAEGEYYWADLEGLKVRHCDGRVLGYVDRLLATGAHDVMVVRSNGFEENREVLIPFVLEKVILGVDLGGKVIDVDWEWN